MSKITTKWITDNAVTKEKINADVAGEGLRQQTDTSPFEAMVHNPVAVDRYIGNLGFAAINALGIVAGDAYVVTDTGVLTRGAVAVTPGDLVEDDGTNWVLIVADAGGFPPVGTRALAGGASGTALVAPLAAATDETKVCEWDGTSLTPALTTPLAGDLAVVMGSGAFREKHIVQLDLVVPTGDWETQIGKLADASSASDSDELPILISGKEYRITRAELLAGAVTEQKVQEMHLITAGETAAGFFTLASNPISNLKVSATPVGGPQQVNKAAVGATAATPDFDILNTNEFHFNNVVAVGLSGDMTTGDVIIVEYEI